MKTNKKTLTADQKKIMALENRIQDLEERLKKAEGLPYKKGEFVQLLGCIIQTDDDDPGEAEHPYLVEIRWEDERDEFPSVWLPQEAFEGGQGHAEDKR